MMIIMTMMITIIIIIIIITIIIIIIIIIMIMKLINTFDAFKVNFLAIYKIDNVQKIFVENKESCGTGKYIYWPFSVHVV